MYHPFENKRESQHWGKREEVYTGISWLTRRDMRNLQFQPNVQRNFVSIVVFISMQASLAKSAESSLREQLCHLQVNTSQTSSSGFLSEKIRVARQPNELDSRAGQSSFMILCRYR